MQFSKMLFALLCVATSPVALAVTPMAAESRTGPGNLPQSALPAAADGCQDFAKFMPRTEAVLHQTQPCETIAPELFGLRSTLAENGMGLALNVQPNFRYDVLGHNEKPQLYNGQNPTYRQSTTFKLTYDLTRMGWGGDAQFVLGGTWESGSYKSGNPNFATMSSFAVNQRFYDGRLELQYGYYNLIREYYGMVLGGNSSAAALGPTSVIPVQLGLSLFTPSPAITVGIKDSSKRWYNRASVARSASPNRFQYDLDENPSGFEIKVKGSRALLVDEVGYKIDAGANRPAFWARAGAIYNTSHYSDMRNGGMTDNNYGGYAAVTHQLTQPNKAGPRGLYLDAKINYAPEDRNLYTKDFQLTAFYIGPFETRQRDMASIGFTRSYFSTYAHDAVEAGGGDAERTSTALSVSYAARMTRGVYWVNGLTYQEGPTFSPARDDALIFQTGLNLSF
ncbi:TPA: carbohydrate porin [Pseudomonas putida]|uniref:carbohydrate porin n=1 Tax=Pseudomonas TaxID=286 RepID=UPI00110CEF20|nr:MULTISPECIES: carbohydrate porin [Pseudomonas]MCS4062195.1 porin [Pseudomonas putida]MCX2891161.1 carbohydrate porin [Pseudomonas sp. DCB_BI]MDD1991415.1 carbohydrate porin [Pseudomonas putida]MDH0704923.1 carbohydrate porin [Pseudomonas sp. GD03862]HDS0918861.1 carbohydrate porin [Pseudomonas putida]